MIWGVDYRGCVGDEDGDYHCNHCGRDIADQEFFQRTKHAADCFAVSRFPSLFRPLTK
jgi:hypothetical protein